jgi:hypothetical protein
MSAKRITVKKKETSKGTILKEITTQLSQALPALRETLGEKKFGKRIKKAAKLLTEGIKPDVSKKTTEVKSSMGNKKEAKTKTPLPVTNSVKAPTAK